MSTHRYGERGRGRTSSEEVSAFAERVARECGLADFWLVHHPASESLTLGKIEVAKVDRGEGRARGAMQMLERFADERGLTVTLSPSSDFGASKRRLEAWYREHGFVAHRGRTRDYRLSGTMIRRPRSGA